MISIPYLICSILSFVPAIVCHEACHGFAAYKLGYAKPVPYNPAYFKDARKGDLIVGLAGPAANLALAILGALVFTAVSLLLPVNVLAQNDLFYYFYTMFLPMFSLINLYLMFFNLLPIRSTARPFSRSSCRRSTCPSITRCSAMRCRCSSSWYSSCRTCCTSTPSASTWTSRRATCSTCCSRSPDSGAGVSYKVRIDSFEGPFDLLLYLVSRQKVDIGAISITQIADQYLAEVGRMDNLDLDVASDFLLVASTLLEIKAESLIPRDRDAVDDDIAELAPSEARDMLVDRLLAYKQFKNAASTLLARFLAEGRMHARPFGPDACFLNLMPDYLKDVTLDGLALLAAQAYARREVFLLESEHIAAKPIPVEVHVRAIHQRIVNKKRLRFSELVDEGTPLPVVVVTFLAVLELYKRAMVKIEQQEQFGDIDIRYIEGSGELVLTGDDALTSVGEE